MPKIIRRVDEKGFWTLESELPLIPGVGQTVDQAIRLLQRVPGMHPLQIANFAGLIEGTWPLRKDATIPETPSPANPPRTTRSSLIELKESASRALRELEAVLADTKIHGRYYSFSELLDRRTFVRYLCESEWCFVDIENVIAAFARERPMLVSRRWTLGAHFLFDRWVWECEKADAGCNTDELRLLCIGAIDTRRQRLERLRGIDAATTAPLFARRSPIAIEVQSYVYHRDGGCCCRCGRTENLHFDHILPVSLNGGSGHENIQLLCSLCNLKKGSLFG